MARVKKRHSTGTYMECGRHGNDWLFGGFSITETVKDLVGKRSGAHGGEGAEANGSGSGRAGRHGDRFADAADDDDRRRG